MHWPVVKVLNVDSMEIARRHCRPHGGRHMIETPGSAPYSWHQQVRNHCSTDFQNHC